MALIHFIILIFQEKNKNKNFLFFNAAQGRILFVLWEHDEIPISLLSKKTQLEKSTLTAMLDRLEKEGFIERIASKEDRRKILIKRTKKDHSLQEVYHTVSAKMSSLFYQGFSEQEVDVFEKNFKKYYTTLRHIHKPVFSFF